MFILVTDKDGYEQARRQAKKFNKQRSLSEAVRYSLIKFLEVSAVEFSATVEQNTRISLVLDQKETGLMSDIIRKLYGPGYLSVRFRDLLRLVALDEVKRVVFGDNENFRVVVEDVCWKSRLGEDTGSIGISIYRQEEIVRFGP